MLNKKKHQLIMGKILKDIYADASIASLLGFKGGTCAYFFYDLPRFSVDLDFDMLSGEKKEQEEVLEKIVKIMEKYGVVKDKRIKRFTIFALLSYGEADFNIKIEINTRQTIKNIKERYELKEYLGMLMLVARKEYLFASKISALTLRKTTAMRDVYDIYYFSKNSWDIDDEAVKSIAGLETKKQLMDCLITVEAIKSNEIMIGLGELVDEKEKEWIRSSLKSETIFMLKNYISVLK
jgi:predicted nucleotidyltransferase component of viral defense system